MGEGGEGVRSGGVDGEDSSIRLRKQAMHSLAWKQASIANKEAG
jgi:hypothetical protein